MESAEDDICLILFSPKAGDCIKFKRMISGTGVGSYRVNDQDVTSDAYNEVLKSINVLVKARNFLVFQGDVESIAAKAPKDLTQLFEQVGLSSCCV